MGEMFEITLKDGIAISAYMEHFLSIHDRMLLDDNSFSGLELAKMMLRGLPQSYAPLIMHLEKQMGVLTPEIVKRELLQEEERLGRYEPGKANSQAVYKEKDGEETESKALYSKRGGRPKKAYEKKETVPTEEGATLPGETGERRPRAMVRCYCCNELGHYARSCFYNKTPRNEKGPEKEEKEQAKAKKASETVKMKALLIRSYDGVVAPKWCLDSGSTNHMVSDRSRLKNIKIDTTVEIANSEKLHVTEMSSVELKLSDKNGGWLIILESVVGA